MCYELSDVVASSESYLKTVGLQDYSQNRPAQYTYNDTPHVAEGQTLT